MKKRLWTVLGPVLIAIAIVGTIMLAPFHAGKLSESTVHNGAVSLSTNVLLGTRLKTQALSTNYVPFVGSSELSRMDPFHPAVLARKYGRDYQPLLLGNAGTQSLTHFVDLQSVIPNVKNKKLVMIVSPQWFTHGGQRPDAFGFYYSPLETSNWLLKAKNTLADRYAARRLLQMPATKGNGVIHAGLLNIAAGQPLGKQRALIAAQRRILQNEDNMFCRTDLVNTNSARIAKAEQWLPDEATESELNDLAGRIAARNTTNNQFGIDNHFFADRLSHGRFRRLRGGQRHFDYRRSPEYSDFELLLNMFAKNNVTVQFIIPPVNQRWAKYTGLSEGMYQGAVTKIKNQLSSQGFDHVLDLSQDGKRKYFMQDTIHLGWRGWVAVDKTVKPFLENKQPAPHYDIDKGYFTKDWQRDMTSTFPMGDTDVQNEANPAATN